MRTVGIRELKNRLSTYLREARAGRTVAITDRGRVVAELTPPRKNGRQNTFAELDKTTRALAEKIAAGPPAVLKMAKHMVNRAATSDLAGALALEAFSQGVAISSEDHQEGLAAFFEKRPPKFTGR